MEKIRLITILILAPAIIIVAGCRSNNKPAEKNLAPETETAKTATQEPEAGSKANGPFAVRSGIIEYRFYGDKTGKSTQYFDDHGTKSAVFTETTSDGETTESWTLTFGEEQYMWDPSDHGEGMKLKNPLMTMMVESAEKDMLSYLTKMYEQMGMAQSGTEVFQGKKCTVYKGEMGKVLIWEGIMMKSEMKVGTMVSGQEVTSIKTNVTVDGKYFRIPDNITFNEIPGF